VAADSENTAIVKRGESMFGTDHLHGRDGRPATGHSGVRGRSVALRVFAGIRTLESVAQDVINRRFAGIEPLFCIGGI
jgi:hypothetical protein